MVDTIHCLVCYDDEKEKELWKACKCKVYCRECLQKIINISNNDHCDTCRDIYKWKDNESLAVHPICFICYEYEQDEKACRPMCKCTHAHYRCMKSKYEEERNMGIMYCGRCNVTRDLHYPDLCCWCDNWCDFNKPVCKLMSWAGTNIFMDTNSLLFFSFMCFTATKIMLIRILLYMYGYVPMWVIFFIHIVFSIFIYVCVDMLDKKNVYYACLIFFFCVEQLYCFIAD